MADDDSRDRGRHRGGGNNRKRRHQEDNDDDRDRRQPRRRYEEPILGRLQRMLIEIADSQNLPEDEAKDIARLLGDHFEESDVKLEFFDALLQLIIEQPFKIPFAAGVLFYTNYNKPDVITEALKRVGERTQQALNAGEWKEFKLLLRFLACLQSLFEGDGVFAILGQLFDSVVDLQSANENDVVGLELVKIILLTIPYALVSGGSEFQQHAKDLLVKTELVASMRLPIEELFETYVGEAEKPFPYYSVIGLLQTQLQNEAANEWKLACIPKFSKILPRNVDENPEPPAPKTHPFPAITIPSPVNPGPRPLFPDVYFSVFADGEVPTVPQTSSIAASLLRDAIVDTIDQLDFNRTAAGKYLIDIDKYWEQGTFIERGLSIERSRERVNESTWKSEDVVVDALFAQIFKLPAPEHKLVYYHSLVTETCKIAPAAIAPSLGRLIRTVYQHIPLLDLQLTYRFLDWFAHHLSNFEFRWKWSEWAADLDQRDLHPKKAFIISVLDKEIRLSFAKRIRSTLPERYHDLIPKRKEQDRPDFKYDSQDTPFSQEGQKLLQQIKKKAPDSEIQETIEVIHTKATELGIEDPLVSSTDALVTSICFVGAISLSHVLFCIERCRVRLLSISQSSEAARRQIVNSVVDYWKDEPGVAVYILDKLLNYTIIAPMTLAQWVFEDHLGAGETLAEGWLFELVSNTVSKVARSFRNILTLKLQQNLDPVQRASIDEAFPRERQNLRDLFKYIEDKLKPVAEGINDKFLEKSGNDELTEEDATLIKEWGQRWYRVFVRQARVEEAICNEEAVEAKMKFLAATEEQQDEPMEDANGGANGAADETVTRIDEDEML